MAFGNAVSVIKEIQSSIPGGGSVQMKQVAGATKSLVDNVLSNRDAMLQMTSLKSHSEYTYYHSANVAILSVSLASTISRDAHFLSSLGSGALLHDIGKLEVGLDIIEKPGRLDADEWEKVRQHPLLGAQMAAQMPGVDSAVLVPILEHHMAWDGSGYPSRTPRRKQHLVEPHRRGRRQLRRDDFEAQLLGRPRSGPGDDADRRSGGHLARPGTREALRPHDGRVPAAVGRSALRRLRRHRHRTRREGRVPTHGARADRLVGQVHHARRCVPDRSTRLEHHRPYRPARLNIDIDDYL